MAYFVDYGLTFGAGGAVTNVVANMPPHQTNDILVVFANMNAGSLTTSSTGWAAISNDTTNTANTSSWTWKRAASSAETFTFSTADDYSVAIFCIRDADTSASVIEASSNTGSTTSTSTPSNVAVTPAAGVNDCFVLYCMSVSGVATAAHCNPGFHHIISSDNGGGTEQTATGVAACWTIHRTGGTATPAAAWTASAAGTSARLTLAIRNVTGGIIPAYVDVSPAPADVISPCHHIGTLNNVVFTNTLTSTATINSKTVSPIAPALQADLGIVPFSNGVSTAAAQQAANSLRGYQITLTGNRDMTTGLVVGSFIGASPKQGAYGIGSVAQGGCVVRIGSSATAWAAYQVAAKDAVPNTVNRAVWAIRPGYTGSTYGTPGTAVTTSAVSHLQFLYNSPDFSSQAILSEVYLAKTHIVQGGTASAPVNSAGLASIGQSYRLPVIQQSGGAGLLSYVPIQIGGADAVYFMIDAGALQFPRNYSTSTKEISFHSDINVVGISYAGKSGDTIKHTNSVVTSPSGYYWEINSAATSAATWDFDGLVVVNALVTLRPVTTFTGITFSQAQSITTNASSLAECTIVSSPEVTAAGATFTSCLFEQSTGTNGALSITGASQAALQTELNKITSTAFNINTTPLGALRIIYTGTAGAISLSMSSNTFSGNTKDIRWEAPAGSNLTFNLSGTANPTTFSATNSNTVTFSNPKTFTVQNIIDQSEVRIYQTSDLTELGGVELVGTVPDQVNNVVVSADADFSGRFKVEYAYNYTVDIPITVVVVNNQYQVLRSTAVLKSTNTSLKVEQLFDRQYENPA